MDLSSRFDPAKATEAILYITQRCKNMYNVLKVLYYADKDHLGKHGRLICGDRYVAMKHGPVPSGAYDMIKLTREDWPCEADSQIAEVLTMSGNTITPSREPNLEVLSPSEVESLDFAIENYGSLPFGMLQDLSYKEAAFREADENDFISMEALAKSLSDGELLWDCLTNN